MITLIGGEKGGSGKSCLAQNLVVYLSQECGLSVMLVDCDPQRTSSDWIQARNQNTELPKINCVQMYGKIRDDLRSLDQHYDCVVVDCGGQDSIALRASLSVAHYAMLPIRPKRRDLKTVPHMEELLSTCLMFNPDLHCAFAITQCPSLPNQAKRIEAARDVCQSWGIEVLNAVTYTRNVYDDSEESGSSVLELEPDSKAAHELRLIYNQLFEQDNSRCIELQFSRSANAIGREQYGFSRSETQL